MNLYWMIGSVTLLVVVALAWWTTHRRQHLRRSRSMLRLLDLADRLEMDLKSCRNGLQRAHAVMSLNPDRPAASEQEARQSIDAGLRALLQQRLWIRDSSAQADQCELDHAVSSLQAARERLRPLQQALNQAQSDLDSAMRDHLPHGP